MTLQQILTAAFANTREHIGTHQERQAESYNKRVHGNPYDQGRLVWLYNPVVPKGRAKKFHKPWTGPYKVLNKLSDSTYRIKHTCRPFRTKVVHFDCLKPCHNDVRLPQVLGPDKQLTHDLQQTSQLSTSKHPIGTNVEIIDVLEPTRRYPLRASRQAPAIDTMILCFTGCILTGGGIM